jgi:hypothetical protein
MKAHIALLSLLPLSLVFALPATAQVDQGNQVVDWDNGPINGTINSWQINSGFVVSDSFLNGTDFVNGLSFGAWLSPGDTLISAEVSITTSEFGGTTEFDEVLNFTQSGCFPNQFGFNVCTETTSFADTMLNHGIQYWLNLQNATTALGDPAYWDQNNGPSLASQNSIGTIPSEAFTLYGGPNQGTSTTTTTSSTSSTPEPSSLMLIASGILALAGMLRRKRS